VPFLWCPSVRWGALVPYHRFPSALVTLVSAISSDFKE
jgi:hypothetical protein